MTSRRSTLLRIACGLAFVLCAGAVLVYELRDTPEEVASTARVERPAPIREMPSEPVKTEVDAVPIRDDSAFDEQAPDPGERWKTAHIEEFKEALYELDIESVEDLEKLDQFVQIGDADTRDFWNTDWTGVDDFKRNKDDFSLEKLDDGTLVFVPGEETRQIYSFFETMNIYDYDEETQEFVHEVDYYGKPIINIVKFLRKDVMIMMVVSGSKVDMNIYELNSDRRD